MQRTTVRDFLNTTASTTKTWESKRTQETRAVEGLLRKSFEQADSYRFNSASVRVRVTDNRFEGMPSDRRDSLLEEQLDKLPPDRQRDLATLFACAPSELSGVPKTFGEFILDMVFDDPSDSTR